MTGLTLLQLVTGRILSPCRLAALNVSIHTPSHLRLWMIELHQYRSYDTITK
jgi:hypothetical protein